jgi:hypothetical protein
MSKIEVDAIDKQSGSTVTIGGSGTNVVLGTCGQTVSLGTGATQTGFGRTGTVDWQTTPKTATFTAANGEGYFANTSGGAFTMNLPAGSAGAIVSVVDYTNTFQTNALTISPNGSEKIGGNAGVVVLNTEGQSVTFVYVDGTEGWKNVQDSTSNEIGNIFITATGGTITTSGNCKIHTFTGPGTFCVSQISNTPANNQVSYMVVAGGGAGGTSQDSQQSGGGGGGGFREDKSPVTPYTSSPLEGAGAISVTATGFPITVGGGGAQAPGPLTKGGNGANSIFSTITSTGGGGAGAGSNAGNCRGGNDGGSGGGQGANNSSAEAGGSGNTPPVSPPQGNNGGPNVTGPGAGGSGGGATAAGTNAPDPDANNPGGAGAATSINATPTTFSTGGSNTDSGAGNSGSNNTGDGGNGGKNANGGAGGSGIVIIRYKFQ